MPGPPVAYPGINPVTINSSGTGSNGVIVNDGSHGLASIPGVVTGNNDVTADDVAAADQAEQNSIQWLFWRTVDWIRGGAYTWTNLVSLMSPIYFLGTAYKFAGIVQITGTGEIEMQSGSVFNADVDSFVVLQGTNTQNGSYTKSGTGAWTAQRKASATGALASFAPEQTDTLWCYNSTSASYIIALTDPNVAGPGSTPLPEGIRCTLVAPGSASVGGMGALRGEQALNTHTVQINDHAGTTLAILGFASTNAKSVTIETVSVSGTIVWDIVGGLFFIA